MRHPTRASVLFSLALAFLSNVHTTQAAVTISVNPAFALLDQRIGILISGLNPNSTVRVAAKSQAQDGLWWRSEAVFLANDRGQINLDRDSPQSGSYAGADAMGLFWSMRPDTEPKRADHLALMIEDLSKPVTTQLEAEDASGTIASASIERRYSSAGVRSRAINGEITARLYLESRRAPLPGVLVIGGSDGGPGAPGVAMLLASHGFAALSLSYFGAPDLPPTLENIPLEYFQKALQWMRSEPDIDPASIAIYAESRGTEAALFVASNDPNITAVVARSPSFTFWSGVTKQHLPGKAAWNYRGQPQAYIANTLYPDFLFTYLWDRVTGRPVRQTPLFLENLQHATDDEKIGIPVQFIRAPLLLLAGADDQIWPSKLMAERIMTRLHSTGHAYRDQLLTFADVGHAIPYVYLPTRGNWQDSHFAVGGTPEGMATAETQAWPQILQFLFDASARTEKGLREKNCGSNPLR
jgi:dipeptidyl aminopeptidase/acylaminoacyl peptidase